MEQIIVVLLQLFAPVLLALLELIWPEAFTPGTVAWGSLGLFVGAIAMAPAALLLTHLGAAKAR